MGLLRRDWDENFLGGGMTGWNDKLRWDAGLKKSMLDPLYKIGRVFSNFPATSFAIAKKDVTHPDSKLGVKRSPI